MNAIPSPFEPGPDPQDPGVHPLPITGELDLHGFRPRDVADVLNAYLDECRVRGILEVRVVHGRGIGQLLRTVHTHLGRRGDVVSYSVATSDTGGFGATWVQLRP